MIKRILILFTLLACLAPPIAGAAQLVDRIVAVVGQDVVMYSELRDKARALFAELQQANTNPMPSQRQIIDRALDALILEQVQLAEAKRLGIEADEETVAEAIGRIAENNGLSVPQLRDALAREGMEFDRFQDNVRNQFIIRRLISREVTNRVQVSKSEVEQQMARETANAGQLQQVHLLHILIATPDGASTRQIQAAADKAAEALRRIDKGEDFRAVAQAMSDGPRALKGGDLGWTDVTALTDQLAAVVAKMQPGEIHGPARSNEGFHLIKLEQRRSPGSERDLISQTRASHILVRTDELTADSDARQRLTQLRERALHGDDFANLARSSSDDQASAIKGGELGWVSPGKMVPEFEEVMDKTAVGEVSEPFKTRFGWHIVKVFERRDHDQTGEAKRLAAREAVRDRKAEEAKQQYLRRLRDEAYIDLRLKDPQ